MEPERSLWGEGNRIGAVMAPIVLVLGTLNWWLRPKTRYPRGNRSIFRTVGATMILAGLTIITTSYRYLRAARETQTLCTDGPYAIVRHPLYATWIWFILPGMALLLRLPFLLLLGAPLMYLVTRQRLPREEAPIEAEFGEKYVTYRENVGALVPRQRG